MNVFKFIKGSDQNTIISSINKHDLMIVGGGGIYSKWTLPFDINLINKIKIPIIIFGAGYNHNYTDRELSMDEWNSMNILNSRARLCSVRDKKTFELVRKQNKNTTLIGDPAIFLKSKKMI